MMLIQQHENSLDISYIVKDPEKSVYYSHFFLFRPAHHKNKSVIFPRLSQSWCNRGSSAHSAPPVGVEVTLGCSVTLNKLPLSEAESLWTNWPVSK